MSAQKALKRILNTAGAVTQPRYVTRQIINSALHPSVADLHVALCYEHDVRPSVCSQRWWTAITQCNKKWKPAHDRIGRCVGYRHAKADANHSIL